jgi:hypothetical protein
MPHLPDIPQPVEVNSPPRGADRVAQAQAEGEINITVYLTRLSSPKVS